MVSMTNTALDQTEQADIRVSVSGPVLTIVLTRPDKRNALTQTMYAAMTAGLEQAAADPGIRSVLIHGEGSVFCSGNDIADFSKANSDSSAATENEATRFINTIATFEKPLVAAVQGLSTGIGLTMLLHCDVVVVTADAKIGAPFVPLGLCPEAGSSAILPARIGYQKAYAVFALGQRLSGDEAVACGLALEVQPDLQACVTAAAGYADALALLPAESLRATKALMRPKGSLDAQITAESQVFAKLLSGPEAAEAFSAFREKRKPDFSKIS